MKPVPSKLMAALWAASVFVFATASDVCFHTDLYVMAIATVVATIVTLCYSIVLINRVLGI
jgi:branched-subunit amino acid transport protein